MTASVLSPSRLSDGSAHRIGCVVQRIVTTRNQFAASVGVCSTKELVQSFIGLGRALDRFKVLNDEGGENSVCGNESPLYTFEASTTRIREESSNFVQGILSYAVPALRVFSKEFWNTIAMSYSTWICTLWQQRMRWTGVRCSIDDELASSLCFSFYRKQEKGEAANYFELTAAAKEAFSLPPPPPAPAWRRCVSRRASSESARPATGFSRDERGSFAPNV